MLAVYYWQIRLGTIFPNGLNYYPVNLTENTALQSFPNTNTTIINNSSVTHIELPETLCFLYNM